MSVPRTRLPHCSSPRSHRRNRSSMGWYILWHHYIRRNKFERLRIAIHRWKYMLGNSHNTNNIFH